MANPLTTIQQAQTTDPEEKTQRIFRYVFFSPDPIEKRRRVLDAFVHRVYPACLIQCGVCKKIKELADQTGDIPRYEFAVKDLGFTHQVTQADKELTFTEVTATIEQEREFRTRQAVTYKLADVSQRSEEFGLSDIRDELTQITSTIVDEVKDVKHVRPSEVYTARENLPAGLLTFVQPVDELIGGVEIGTMMVLLGFTGHFKTTAAINMLYNNCVVLGYNVAFFTMEVPKEQVSLAILSRHSFNPKFHSVHPPVKAMSIRKNLLEEDEKKFLFDVVEPDLYENKDYGKFYLLENYDFATIDVPGMSAMLNELSLKDGSTIDCLMVDYLQLFQYLPVPPNVPKGISVGDFFVREFAELAKNCNGKRMAVILLSQANREGHKRAVRNDGKYDLQALAEFHELERSASYILSLYTDDQMREINEVKVCLMKNRFGNIMDNPVTILTDPQYCVLGLDHLGFKDFAEVTDLDSYLDL